MQPVTHGSTNQAVSVNMFRLTETSHAPGTRLPRHAHANAAITFVLGGRFAEDFGAGREHECQQMSLLFKPAGAPHSNRYGPSGARSFIVEYLTTEEIFSGFENCAPQLGFLDATPLALELYRAFRTSSPEELTTVEELAVEIIESSRRRPHVSHATKPGWLSEIVAALRDATNRPSLGELAAMVDVHPGYLARAFRRHVGCSIGVYLRRLRLRRAITRLAEPGTTLPRISLESGFADQPHFTRVFHREVGMTPARVRRMAGKSGIGVV